VYRVKVVALHEAIEDEETRDKAFQIIRELVEKVIIHDRADGGGEIEIASMVHIAMADNKKSCPFRGGFE
jgi:hypothetical protein